MKTKVVKYGHFKISVDIDKTKEFYKNYSISETQAHRNFAVYCKSLSEGEQSFFGSFGIDPLCCEIEHIGVSKKKEFPCGGYYLIAGEYLEYPKENIVSIEEFVEFIEIDSKEYEDPRINIGLFQFDFQVEEYIGKQVPEDMPDGFICVRFWCEDMKWLLSEKPEEIMYEPPKFWELGRIIKEFFDRRAAEKRYDREAREEWCRLFDNNGIIYTEIPEKELLKYKISWLSAFAPTGADLKKLKDLCVKNRSYTPFPWHLFSYEYVKALENDEARTSFDIANKEECILFDNILGIGYRLRSADRLTAKKLDEVTDLTISSAVFSWTYSKTHEEYIGPYFYKKDEASERGKK